MPHLEPHQALLEINKPYPFKSFSQEGASSNFFMPTLRNDAPPINRLLFCINKISKLEAKVLRHGKMSCGLLEKDGAILLLWQFIDKKGVPWFTFDSPFDVTLLKEPEIHEQEGRKGRLLCEVHIVDVSTNLVRGLRQITMPAELTHAFLAAVRDQYQNKDKDNNLRIAQHAKWQRSQPQALVNHVKMYTMGIK